VKEIKEREQKDTYQAPRVSSPQKKEEKSAQKSSKSSAKTSLVKTVKAVVDSAPPSDSEVHVSVYSDLISTWSILLDPIYYSVLGFVLLIILFGINNFTYAYSGTHSILPYVH